jgi:hypothetical protein
LPPPVSSEIAGVHLIGGSFFCYPFFPPPRGTRFDG